MSARTRTSIFDSCIFIYLYIVTLPTCSTSLPRAGARVSVQMIAQAWSDMPVSELQRILGFGNGVEAVAFAEAYGVPVIDGNVRNRFFLLFPSRRS